MPCRLLSAVLAAPVVFFMLLSPDLLRAAQNGQSDVPQIDPVTAYPDNSISIEQLKDELAGLQGKSDWEFADEVRGLRLSQRLSTATLQELQKTLPGKQSAKALLAVVDASAFLDLPAGELLALPAPDRATQGKIISLAADFVVKTMSKMPNFIATKTTTRFRDEKAAAPFGEAVILADRKFRFIDTSEVTAVYRDGKEEDKGPKQKRPENSYSAKPGLYSWGVFGPLMSVVMSDLLKGKIGWSHWEQSPNGPAAVFHFVISEDKSTYAIRFCCVRGNLGWPVVFSAKPAYHGEIAIDPNTGAVMRIVLKTDLKPGLDLSRLDSVVEYSPVDIGGRSFICPVKYVALSTVMQQPTKRVDSLDADPQVTAINDVVFDHYHQFRGEMRIVPQEGGYQQVAQ